MREIRRFELDALECISRRVAATCAIEVEAGRLWITIENDPVDYWLEAGQRLELPARARLWLSAEANGARLKVIDQRSGHVALVQRAKVALPRLIQRAANV
jgi:hypothetical protein